MRVIGCLSACVTKALQKLPIVYDVTRLSPIVAGIGATPKIPKTMVGICPDLDLISLGLI